MSSSETEVASEPVAEVINPHAAGRFVLLCEHASNHIPETLDGLGLDEAAKRSHVAWDPGAAELARAMSDRLDAPLVLARISRLVYDCNRPPHADAAMPARSELYDVPGNANLSEADRKARVCNYYDPFCEVVSDTLDRAGPDVTLVTIHTFTPVYYHKPRDVEIGILHDSDRRLADLMLASASDHGDHLVRRNEPYSPEDGVTHSLKLHAIRRGLSNVMLEVRNDLVATADDQARMADMLSGWLTQCVSDLTASAEMAS